MAIGEGKSRAIFTLRDDVLEALGRDAGVRGKKRSERLDEVLASHYGMAGGDEDAEPSGGSGKGRAKVSGKASASPSPGPRVREFRPRRLSPEQLEKVNRAYQWVRPGGPTRAEVEGRDA